MRYWGQARSMIDFKGVQIPKAIILHAVTDTSGRPIRFAGQVSDYTGAHAHVSGLPAADWFREDLVNKGITPCTPRRKPRDKTIKYNKRRYKRRNRIEIMFRSRCNRHILVIVLSLGNAQDNEGSARRCMLTLIFHETRRCSVFMFRQIFQLLFGHRSCCVNRALLVAHEVQARHW